MELLGHTLDVIGKVMISYTAIAVHNRVRRQHKVDEVVFRQMRREQFVGILGIILIILGYLLEIPSKIS